RRTRAAGAAGARRIRPLRSIATTTGVTSRSSSATSRTAAISSPSVRPDPCRVPTRRSVAAGADGPREIGLGHRAAPGNSHLARAVVELLLGALFERTVGIAGALGGPVRRAAFLAPLLVHRARGDLLRPARGGAAPLRALAHVLVLTLVLGGPGSRHRAPLRSRARPRAPGCRAGTTRASRGSVRSA